MVCVLHQVKIPAEFCLPSYILLPGQVISARVSSVQPALHTLNSTSVNKSLKWELYSSCCRTLKTCCPSEKQSQKNPNKQKQTKNCCFFSLAGSPDLRYRFEREFSCILPVVSLRCGTLDVCLGCRPLVCILLVAGLNWQNDLGRNDKICIYFSLEFKSLHWYLSLGDHSLGACTLQCVLCLPPSPRQLCLNWWAVRIHD